MDSIFTCEHCSRTFNTYKGLVTHIGKSCIGGKMYYDLYVLPTSNNLSSGKCEECGSQTTFLSIKEGYGRFCSSKCAGINQGTKDKYNKNFLAKYGVSRPMQSSEIKNKYQQKYEEKTGFKTPLHNVNVHDKIKNTVKLKYNVNSVLELQDIKDKSANTKFIKYGNVNYNNHDKYVETCMHKYNVDNTAKLAETRIKKENSNFKALGVNYPMQSTDVFNTWKSKSYSNKQYTFPSGRVEYVQGYEQYAIDILLANGINEDQIIVDSNIIPKFEYFIDSKRHMYYPDILVKDMNLIIEIKSTYTKRIDKFLNDKLKAVANSGYNCELWVIDKKKLLKKELYGKNGK